MTVWFVSRHPGALEWAGRRGLTVDRFAAHLDPGHIQPGDTVIGSLPVNLAALVCHSGAKYLNLSVQLPAHLRGQELSADQLEALGAKLEEYSVTNMKD
jgi:CRISPR-associated protein Csx16